MVLGWTFPQLLVIIQGRTEREVSAGWLSLVVTRRKGSADGIPFCWTVSGSLISITSCWGGPEVETENRSRRLIKWNEEGVAHSGKDQVFQIVVLSEPRHPRVMI